MMRRFGPGCGDLRVVLEKAAGPWSGVPADAMTCKMSPGNGISVARERTWHDPRRVRQGSSRPDVLIERRWRV